jgi:hypothetical protein
LIPPTRKETTVTEEQKQEPPESPTYELSLTGEGISVTRRVTEGEARDIIGLVLGGEARPSPSAGRAPAASAVAGQSIREFLNEVEATKNPEMIAAAVAHLMDTTGASSVPAGDIRGQFRAAGEPLPANFARDLRLSAASGWIAEDPAERGRYFITKTGRDAIALKFQGQKIRRPRRRGRKSGSEEAEE